MLKEAPYKCKPTNTAT